MELKIDKDWCIKAAERDGDAEVGAGFEMCPAPSFWRHKKRGTVYEVLTATASLQCAAAPEFEQMFEEDDFIVYRSVDTGSIYVRPALEFLDGRFEQVVRGASSR